MRGLVLFLSILCAAMLAPASARAQSIPLAELSCTGGAVSQDAAFALALADLDCGPDRFRTTSRFVRVHSDLGAVAVPGGDLVWQTDPSVFNTMALLIEWSDGSQSRIDVTPETAVRNWAAIAKFSVALPRQNAGVAPVSIDMVVENPAMLATARDTSLSSRGDAARQHFSQALVSTLVCGFLLAPIFYTLYFYRVMRAPFMLWHCVMSLGMAVFIASNAGLVFEVLPDLSLASRWQINSTSITAAVFGAVAFSLGMLEGGVLGQLGRRLLLATLVPVVLAKLAVLLAPAEVRTTVGWYYALSFVPMMVILPSALVAAVRRGSRAALFALIGFGALALAGFFMMIDGIGLVDLRLAPEDAMLGSMVLMSLITSVGMGRRFIAMRFQLERERRRSAALGALAFSDSLTGLGNRRVFEARETLAPHEALLVADIDHFKAINDSAGHRAGDEALVRLADGLRQFVASREGGAVYRLGGEEFGIILAYENDAHLRECCEQLHRTVDACGPLAEGAGSLTVSIGAVAGIGQSITKAFMQADEAMYMAKAAGRNCTRLANKFGHTKAEGEPATPAIHEFHALGGS